MSLKLAFVIEAVDKATAKVRAVNQQVEKASEPARRARAAFNALGREAGLSKLGTQLGTIADKARGVVDSARSIVSAFGAITIAAGGVFWALKRTIDQVDRQADVAKKLGITTAEFQRLAYAAQLNGSSEEEMGQALTFLSQNMVEAINGSKEAQLWFSRVGITMAQIKRMNAVQVFEAIADKFSEVGDAGQNASKKIAVMRALMGRGGAELKQVLDQGSAGLKKFYAEAERLGAVLDNDTAEAMADFNDNFDRMKFSLFGVMAQITKTALPALDALVKKFTAFNVAGRGALGDKLGRVISDIVDKLPAFVDGLLDVLSALMAIAGWVHRVVQAMGGWHNVMLVIAGLLAAKLVVGIVSLGASIAAAIPTVISIARAARLLLVPVLWDIAAGFVAISAALLANPITWIVLAIVAAAVLLYKYWGPIKQFFVDLWEGITAAFTAAYDWIMEKVQAVVRLATRVGKAIASVLPGLGDSTVTVESASVAASPFGGAAGGSAVNGTIRIEVDQEGRARVASVKSESRHVDFDVYSGMQMVAP